MKIKLLLFGILSLSLSGTYAQEYLEMIEDGSYRVDEIVESAEAYFADRDKGRGSGYKQFKRWEYMANRLQNEAGYLVSLTENMEELARYEAYLNNTANNRGAIGDNWIELGPDDWNATSAWSPGVGRITGFHVDPNNTDRIVVGANTGGVWNTFDGGENWTPLSDYFSNLSVYSIAVDPADSDTYFFGSNSGLIYKSTDAGATWTQLADLSNSRVIKILINPSNSDIIFACSENAGLYRTTDGGVNWTQVISGNAYDVEYKPGDLSVMYAGSQSVWRSTDGGASFAQVGSWNGEAKMIGVSPDDPEVVYVVDEDNGGFGDLYKSTDSGLSYISMGHSNRNYFGYDTAGFESGGQAPRDMDIAVNPNNVDEVHIAGVLTWRSLDGGENFICTSDWIPGQAASAGRGYHHADVDILEFVGSTLYVGSDGGIFKATDTENLNANYYEDLTAGLGIRQLYRIGVSQTADVKITTGSQDNGSTWYTEAVGWRDWLGADGMEGFIALSSNNLMFGTTQFGQLYRSTNGGNSYSGLPEPGQGQGNWVSPFEQDPSVAGTIYVGYNIVYRSTNNGAGGSWSAISQNFGGNLDEMKVAPVITR
ncbi:VPS10 domain-containing protein [Aureitalea marina]|nr:YCF48-related protein [Aureitalea marina]